VRDRERELDRLFAAQRNFRCWHADGLEVVCVALRQFFDAADRQITAFDGNRWRATARR
jgi:hypothetical protein